MDEIPLGAFISITYRSNFVRIKNKMKELGLSTGQFFVLMVLSHEQGLTQDALAWHLLIDKGSIARAVNVLEDQGYVKRITDESNRRAVRLYFTEKGEELVPEIHKIDRELEEGTLSLLTEEEKAQARVLLRKMAQGSYEAAHENNENRKEFPLKK